MRRALSILLWCIATATTTLAEPTVCVVPVREDITQNTVYLLRRALREANAKNAIAIVLDMDTNGGRVDMTEEIIRLLEHTSIKTYTLVDQKAYSAGAYIAAATDHIYMTPGSVIGAATPVMLIPGSGVQELPKSYEEKLSSAMRALIRATAQHKGHNPAVFEAMVDKDIGLTIEGVVISEKGKLLTLTNKEAGQAYGLPPKALLSAGTVTGVEQLLAKTGLANATVVTVTPTGFEVLGRWLTAISPLLILIGFAAIYIEFKVGGIGLPLLVAVIAFGLYFLAFFVAGLAGWEQVALFGFGLALLAVEIFLLPGHVLPGLVGLGCILVALVLAMTERWPGEPLVPTWPQLKLPLARLAFGFFGAIASGIVIGRYLPKTSLFRKMELTAATSAAAGYTTASDAAASLMGTTGVAETNLRPSGSARFGEQLVDVVTEGDLIERGAPVTIVKVEGSRVVVVRAARG